MLLITLIVRGRSHDIAPIERLHFCSSCVASAYIEPSGPVQGQANHYSRRPISFSMSRLIQQQQQPPRMDLWNLILQKHLFFFLVLALPGIDLECGMSSSFTLLRLQYLPQAQAQVFTPMSSIKDLSFLDNSYFTNHTHNCVTQISIYRFAVLGFY